MTTYFDYEETPSESIPDLLYKHACASAWDKLSKDIDTATPEQIKYQDEFKQGVLLVACAYNAPIPVIEKLLDAGLDVNGLTYEQSTPVHLACNKQASVEVLAVLLERGGNPNLCDSRGQTALLYGCMSGCPTDKILFLLEFGCDINATNKQGEKPIDIARRNGDHELIALLSSWPPTKTVKVV